MGKTLYLLRHAKSSWDDPTLLDYDRRLAPRGRDACRLVADHLRAERITPALVLCSPAVRTRQTLERIAVAFRGKPEVRFDDRLYGASAAELLQVLREVAESTDSVLLIGHNPAIQVLASSLAGRGSLLEALEEKFPTAALATLAVPGRWDALAAGAAELVGFVKPRDLGSTPE